jgi:hypothetical protein
MAMLTLAAVLPLLLGLDVSGGGVSGGGVRSSSESSMGLIARGNAVAFGGCIMAFGDCIIALGLEGSSSISESLSCLAGSKGNFAG